MYFVYIVVGVLAGGFFAGGGQAWPLGAFAGAMAGYLLARLIKAERRISELEAGARRAAPLATAAQTATPRPAQTAIPPGIDTPSSAAPETSQHPPGHATDAIDGSSRDVGARHPPGPPGPQRTAAARTAAPPEVRFGGGETDTAGQQPPEPDDRSTAPPPQPARPLQPSIAENLIRKVAAWFTSGNVPVKVGVVISFIGVAFLLKYAIDRELVQLPIEFRLLGVALGGIAMLVLGWRLRHSNPVYALSMQGGGAGILFLTIFAAFRIWQLIPASLAFVLLALLAAFTGALAVLQKSRWLILLGAVGGFLAPVLASTGQGSHVALFSYYLVINAAILGVAWYHSWRSLNVVGFVFTFVIGSLWGYRYYRPEFFASTEPFLVLYFLFYQAIAILFALRQPPQRAGLVDGTLVFGTPVIAFGLQAGLLRGSEYGLAISAAVLALFYVVVATVLHRRKGAQQRVLVESYVALAVAFATLAIPLALEARWTAAAWALEGAALVWVGMRQSRHLAVWAGAALVGFSGFAFALSGWTANAAWPVLNSNVLGGVLISLSALFCARTLQPFGPKQVHSLYRLLGWVLFAWGVAWWFGTGIMEIDDRVNSDAEAHILLLFVALSNAGFALAGHGLNWPAARRFTWLYLPVLAGLAALYMATVPRHFLFGLGWLAWPLAFVVQGWLLRQYDRHDTAGALERLRSTWHGGSILLLAAMASSEVSWQLSRAVAGDWHVAAASAVPGIIALLIWRFRHRPAWPVPAHAAAYLGTSLLLMAVQVLYVVMMSIEKSGHPGPLAYIPLLNPFDLAMLFAGVTALLALGVLRQDADRPEAGEFVNAVPLLRWLLAAAFFILSTAALVRGVHHYTQVPWDYDLLFHSVVVQTSLSIYWGMLGFIGMIYGARSGRRPVWIAGAGFMGLVVIKLFLVDLGNSGTIERIISFIGIGVLLLVVGYFAPAPPRQTAAAEPAAGAADS